MKISLSNADIIRGLKHYRGIAKQDIVRADDTGDAERLREHANARRQIYKELIDIAENEDSTTVLQQALTQYSKLPFVTGTPEDEYIDIKGQESALENFFLMIGLDAKTRRETRSKRPSLKTLKEPKKPTPTP